MLVAGMREDGTVEVLGFCISSAEQCHELLEDLRRRDLEDVESTPSMAQNKTYT